MATVSKSGKVKSTAAGMGTFSLTIEWENPSPPPAMLNQTWEILGAEMQRLASGADPGDDITVSWDTADVTKATALSRP